MIFAKILSSAMGAIDFVFEIGLLLFILRLNHTKQDTKDLKEIIDKRIEEATLLSKYRIEELEKRIAEMIKH
jgi:hypothetical protein